MHDKLHKLWVLLTACALIGVGCAYDSAAPEGLNREDVAEYQAGDDDESAVSVSSQALLNGTASGNTTVNNAIVRVIFNGSACTGTLITPTMVLTAGHCGVGLGRGDVPDSWLDGTWRLIPNDKFATIIIGPNTSKPVATYRAYFFNQPPLTKDGGHSDAMLFGIYGGVRSTEAAARKVVVNTTDTKLSSRDFCVYGYGGETQRRLATTNNYKKQDGEKFHTDIETPSNALSVGGDSGGPAFVDNCSGPVVGVTQGSANGGATVRSTKTWTTGPSDLAADMRAWLTNVLQAGGWGAQLTSF